MFLPPRRGTVYGSLPNHHDGLAALGASRARAAVQVACEGAGALHRAAQVAAAKIAITTRAATPAADRAKMTVKLGDSITRHVPEIANLETRDTGQKISQTGKQLVPRAADNFYLFAERCTRAHTHHDAARPARS